jgi:YbgC/YbaW family acyl-CoA thioester hydrolase
MASTPDLSLANYPRPSLAVDLMITSVSAQQELMILLVKRTEEPFAGQWSLPGGFVYPNESVAQAASRVLERKTGLTQLRTEELGTFSEPQRDPRGWVVSIAHLALVPSDTLANLQAGSSTEAAQFWVVSHLDGDQKFSLISHTGQAGPSKLAFDHEQIVTRGLGRLRRQVENTTLAFGLLPSRFTLPEAQQIVEAILGKKLDKAAFRTKVLSLGLVRPTSEERRGGAHRPAKLYVAAPGWEEGLFAVVTESDPSTSIYQLSVRFCETDLMGIVHHSNYLQYFEAGRVHWLKRRGVSYETWVQQGIHLPVVEVRIRYRKAAQFDDELAIETSMAELTKITVRFRYVIRRLAPKSGDLICEGETLLACVGTNLAPKRMPENITQVLRSPELEHPLVP